MISGVRQEDYYKAIQYLHISAKYPIKKLCQKLSINRSAYYKWLHREPSSRQHENEQIVEWIKELYEFQLKNAITPFINANNNALTSPAVPINAPIPIGDGQGTCAIIGLTNCNLIAQ